METTKHTTKLRKRLFDRLGRVPESDIRQVSDFVEFILDKRRRKQSQRAIPSPDKDPLLKMMGKASVVPFSKDIDRELYAE
jgi:hypothetical protein